MARLQPSIVPVSRDDLDRVAALWVDHRAEDGHSREAARRAVDEARFADAILRDRTTMLVAWVDVDPVGYVWLSTEPMSAQLDVPSVAVEDVYVVPGMRGQGLGKALLAAAAGYAHKRGVEHVTCSVPSQAKDANRSLARLGFAAVVTRRVAQTTTLMRRLRGPEPRGNIDQLLLQRRRRAQRTRPVGASIAVHS